MEAGVETLRAPEKKMKPTLFKKLIGAIATAVVLSFAVPHAQAGPGPHTYVPVTTMAAADALQPGQKIAIRCPDCGTISMMTVDKDRNVLKSYTCPHCHTVFESTEGGTSGKTHTTGKFALICKATGEHAELAVLQ
jgi:predicted RNA-binding Zn-ribbon protein involved in translation (DUF1610 family)